MLFALYLNAIGILLGQSRGWEKIEGFRIGPPVPQRSLLQSGRLLDRRFSTPSRPNWPPKPKRENGYKEAADELERTI
jgi:hypothetical protein